MKKLISILLALMLFVLSGSALSESDMDDSNVYTMLDLEGHYITSRAGRIYVDDEYISSDNQLYVVVQVNDTEHRAIAAPLGEEPPVNSDKAREVFAHADESAGNDRRLICMYATHSDESYVPTDGDSSLLEDPGIHDVAEAFEDELEKLGIEVELDETSHLPHDAKAYSRSRRTAEELMKMSPDALIDIHRDGIPDESEYETTVHGEETSKIRLLVGRSNPNADANREFAKQIKEVADEKYDSLIKDIFLGKGNYNQELYPQAILLEFGTHTLDKELVLNSTPMMADVMSTVLYGDTARADPAENVPAANAEENKAGGSGIIWLVIVAALGGLIYMLISTGTFRDFGSKVKKGFNEVTGGALGRKDKDK